MSAQEIARALLDFYDGDARRWTQGALARGGGGAELYDEFAYDPEALEVDDSNRVTHDDARCWCIAGADEAIRGTWRRFSDPEWNEFDSTVHRLTGLRAVDFNDAPTTRFADVVALLERIAAEPTP